MNLQYNAGYFVYILTNQNHSLLDVGVTGGLKDMLSKVEWHAIDKPSSGNICTFLVYIECFSDVNKALEREQKIKSFSKSRKKELIAQHNPEWHVLNKEVYEQEMLRGN